MKIEGEFYDRTTTSECSEDRIAVPSMVKTESELCVCAQRMFTLHTHIWRTAKLSDQINKHWLHPHYLRKLWSFIYFSMELHYSNSCQQFSACIYSTHALTSNQFSVCPQASQPFIYPFVYQSSYMHNTRAHSCMQPNEQSEWVDSTSLWGAYPGVLSDTPTECVTQCANVASLKQTPDIMQTMH